MRLTLALIACTAALPFAAPAHAEVVENDVIKVFEGQWVQSKDPTQNGLLMYLTQERSSVGEYFSIRCEDAAPSVRIAYPKRRSAKDIGLTVDGSQQRVAARFTGKTKDVSFSKGNLFGYALEFPDTASRDAFLASLRGGTMLVVEGQTLPVDLKGARQAVAEQAAYCG
jgi:hypothetical protein